MATILITGATSGLGRALAEDLAGAGHQLLLHGRDHDRLAEVASATGGETYQADLTSLAATRDLAAEVARRHDRLDVLVNNAGIGFHVTGTDRQLSKDGLELRLAVNYLAPVLLTRELLPLLRAAAPSRIVNVASVGQAAFDFEDPDHEKDFTEPSAYSRSKLALISWSASLAEELDGTGITVNSLHPATFMPTRMVEASGVDAQESLEKGLHATRRLVDDPALAGVSGKYFHSENEAQPSIPEALTPEYRARLAQVTEKLLTAARA
ncbi:SDR family NAD(P)-dependent oxidoreductase [Kineosporia rhizophila]|uniref:SDR family NAD(P)-dependent oxidoreductase n=1 Tax=Kineosporia rhizophila TaxID=84633 RepID=UPI001E470C77|nr:SDR family NAD(P)-dependent oxidoreductase [Kineosporia rhizophila]MCE0535330.1 SDR family NAD(P)-dependent oxidoreductase [Kineosporia rhizophila]